MIFCKFVFKKSVTNRKSATDYRTIVRRAVKIIENHFTKNFNFWKLKWGFIWTSSDLLQTCTHTKPNQVHTPPTEHTHSHTIIINFKICLIILTYKSAFNILNKKNPPFNFQYQYIIMRLACVSNETRMNNNRKQKCIKKRIKKRIINTKWGQ